MTDAVKLPTAEQIDAIYRDVWSTIPHTNRLTEFARKTAALAIMQERERCAKLCELERYTGYVPPEDGDAASYYDMAGVNCADAIRAQPEPTP